jgi:hypothetical protein
MTQNVLGHALEHASPAAVAPATGSAWLISPRFDLAVFVAPALIAVGLAALGGRLADGGSETPTWAWLVFVVGIDVAHVHATTLRVYCDRAELARRPWLYSMVPLLGLSAGALAYAASPALFWRCLAYLALFHFVRQQIGWARLYRRRARARSRFDARLDEATLYAATLYPVIHWHTRLPVEFHWLLPGDFIAGLPLWAAGVARALWAALLGAFALRQLQLRWQGEPLQWGKLLLVATTALSWWAGIVLIASDFAFTLTNVVAHGVPYMLVSWRLGQGAAPRRFSRLPVYVGALCALAFVEEWLWDAGVWRDHPQLFPSVELDPSPWWGLIVPLLALPQVTHYVLDAYLWRMDGHNPAVGKLLGEVR